jgi:hypothetical protein
MNFLLNMNMPRALIACLAAQAIRCAMRVRLD